MSWFHRGNFHFQPHYYNLCNTISSTTEIPLLCTEEQVSGVRTVCLGGYHSKCFKDHVNHGNIHIIKAALAHCRC